MACKLPSGTTFDKIVGLKRSIEMYSLAEVARDVVNQSVTGSSFRSSRSNRRVSSV